MRTLLLILALALPLGGCETLGQPLHGKTSTEAAAVQTTRTAIDETYAALISINTVISENVTAKVWTPAQAKPYLDRSRSARQRADQARELLRLGDITQAESQAKILRELITTLQREIALQARKP